MTQPQPILYSAFQDDLSMPYSSSLNNPSGSFNPASYTRAFFGSPFSWRPGSFGNRSHPGSSPTQLLGPLDPTDLRGAGKISSSIESDRGSLLNALSAMEREEELCRNYTCCGLNLQDLHALVEHFEECHVVVLDSLSQPSHNQLYSQPAPTPNPKFDSYPPQLPHHLHQQPHQQLQLLQQQQLQQQHRQLQQQSQPPHQQQGPFDPDDMELDIDSSPASSSASSPPLTPVTTPLVPYTAQPTFHMSFACLCFRHDGRSPIARNSIHNLPVPSTPEATSQPGSPFSCVPPTLLYSSNSTTPANTPSSSRVASPASTSASASSSTTPSPTSTPRASYHPLSSCFFPPPLQALPLPEAELQQVDLEALQALLAEKGVVVNGNDRSGMQITEGEAPPFACGVGDCQRRYKNMNGLRTIPVTMAAIGLQLLASGQHECLQHSKSAAATRQSTPANNPASPVGAGSQSPTSPAKSPTTQSWHYPQGYSQQQQYSPSAQQRQYLGQQVPVQQQQQQPQY
ncbi:hypothetical protein H4582DRAFT_1948408 [Lactarius indigo]|nr:hypothetical protein H4582DRAFT_1948408 [Lactarius indigo]